MKFLTTRQINGEIEYLIKDSSRFIILITPFVDIADDYILRLQDAGGRKVNIHIVFGKKELKTDVENSIKGLVNLKMYFLENLHAKCYLNDKVAIITSMNLYQASEKNREIGILFDKVSEKTIYDDIVQEADSIIKASTPYTLKVNPFEWISQAHHGVEMGHCIRCNAGIIFTPYKPLCRGCYEEWAKYFNYTYTEKYCHLCGKEKRTSMNKPLCIDCFKQVG